MARSPSRREERGSDRDRARRPERRDGDNKRRDRSSDRERRYDDRGDYRRRDRSRDRYDDRRGPRRERSKERKRSRERSPVRDRRNDRDRYRDDRDYDDRDRKRSRLDDGSSRRSGRDDSRERNRPTSSRGKESNPPIDPEAAAEAAKNAKLARVAAWKKKMEEKRRQEAGLAASPPSTSAPSPAAASTGTLSQPTTTPGSPAPQPDEAKPSSPAPYAGKFDPKAIAKRAAAALERHKAALGGDVVIPKSANDMANKSAFTPADQNKVAPSKLANGRAKPIATNAKISVFGLNKASGEKSQEKSIAQANAAAPLEDDEETSRKLEKLPDMPTSSTTEDAALANMAEEEPDEGDDIESDEEEAEAAREAAHRRAEEAQAQQQDSAMTDIKTSADFSQPEPMDEDEEIDPLDAFMSGLEKPPTNTLPNLAIGKGKKKAQTQMFNSDDEEADMDAVGSGTEDILALAAKKKKKDLPTTDHSKIQYEPFRKNFYSESPELAEMTQEEVDALRIELENIKCRGVGAPKPILKWPQGGFGTQILDVIKEQKFEKPTAIQSQALPAIMSGRDVIGVAKTGSGKTVAFILPMFRHIKDQRPVEGQDGPIGLILAPTRELATQIFRDCKPYLKALNLRGSCVYGGAPIKDQIAELKRGAEIVVATPGRFIEMLTANAGRVTNLRRITYVVLDEADRMFDMGFEPQITKILNNIRPGRQTVLFSATFPKNMEALARKALKKPIEITVGGRSVVAPEITQIIEVREEETKFRRLLELLGNLYDDDEDARTLIFVERQEMADSMLKELLRKSYPCTSIHGGREQIDRDEAITNFKSGAYPVMIATSVAARGLDVKQLKLVVNFDSPNHGEDYVHRCGRTGRAGNKGTAVTFVTPEQDRFAPFLIKALNDSKQEVPEDLKQLAKVHEEKIKSGAAKKVGSGFGGKGIEKLEAARDAERAAQRKQYKTGDEPEEEEEVKKEDKAKTDAMSKADEMVAKATGSIKDRDAQPEAPPARAGSELIPSSLEDHLRNAMKVQKVEKAPTTKALDPLEEVRARVASINDRLGQRGTRPGVPIDNRGPDAGAFHSTLEINDFPQKARWGVTNRTNVAKILEATGTSITTKGEFYPQDRQPEPGGPPKLYILVEGDTELVVESAMKELTRLLRDGLVAHYTQENRAPTSGGRYNVV